MRRAKLHRLHNEACHQVLHKELYEAEVGGCRDGRLCEELCRNPFFLFDSVSSHGPISLEAIGKTKRFKASISIFYA
jgi:hypothetical protein